MAAEIIGRATTDDGSYQVKWDRATGEVSALYRGSWLPCGRATIDAEEAILVATDRIYSLEIAELKGSGGCIIATACKGPDDAEVARLRAVRDDAISSDPIARDFFHVFWSRYYEWSPGVARIAARDRAVADHIRWAFLEPWLAWMELVTAVGRRPISDLDEEEKDAVLESLGRRLSSWLDELPSFLEGKRPEEEAAVYAAFDRLRALASEHTPK